MPKPIARALFPFVVVCATALSAAAQDRRIDAHPPGYVPTTVPATTKLVVGRYDVADLLNLSDPRTGFDIYVTPNIVPQAEALARAAARAGAYCRSIYGSDRVHFLKRVRHSDLSLESWAFRGVCGG